MSDKSKRCSHADVPSPCRHVMAVRSRDHAVMRSTRSRSWTTVSTGPWGRPRARRSPRTPGPPRNRPCGAPRRRLRLRGRRAPTRSPGEPVQQQPLLLSHADGSGAPVHLRVYLGQLLQDRAEHLLKGKARRHQAIPTLPGALTPAATTGATARSSHQRGRGGQDDPSGRRRTSPTVKTPNCLTAALQTGEARGVGAASRSTQNAFTARTRRHPVDADERSDYRPAERNARPYTGGRSA